MRGHRDAVRVLVVPGLHDSGPTHWQTWLEAHHRRAVRVRQDDWACADLERWADRVGETVARDPQARWVAVAHSFGCLAVVRHLARGGPGLHAALLVAPADPDKFGIDTERLQQRLAVPAVLVGSDTDPWMSAPRARSWAQAWGAQFINLGDVGHLNVAAGFGPLPQAKTLTEVLIQRVERTRRLDRAHPMELSFAI
jgi:uncharacterized protein